MVQGFSDRQIVEKWDLKRLNGLRAKIKRRIVGGDLDFLGSLGGASRFIAG